MLLAFLISVFLLKEGGYLLGSAPIRKPHFLYVYAPVLPKSSSRIRFIRHSYLWYQNVIIITNFLVPHTHFKVFLEMHSWCSNILFDCSEEKRFWSSQRIRGPYWENPGDLWVMIRKYGVRDYCHVWQLRLSEGRPDIDPQVGEGVDPTAYPPSATTTCPKLELSECNLVSIKYSQHKQTVQLYQLSWLLFISCVISQVRVNLS